MASIIERIEKISSNKNKTIFQLIATKLIDGFYSGKFYQEKILAEKCFTGCSTVTKFSKTLGLSGYRELIIRIHYEYEIMVGKKKQSINFVESNTFMIWINDWVKDNFQFITTFVKDLKKFKHLNIFTSYQSFENSMYLKTILESLNIKVNVITGQDIANSKDLINNAILNLFIITGQDNNQITYISNHIFSNQDKESYLISTVGQQEKIRIEFKEKLLINIKEFDSTKISRQIVLNNLFFMIFSLMK